MTTGPGKYDDAATVVRLMSNARGVAVIVVGGDKGNGFSMQTDDPEILVKLPTLLRAMADVIENDVNTLKPPKEPG